MPYTLILQELKRLILVKAEIKVISPSDCRIISMSIQKETKKNISETTIKRLFGFAEIKHQFSKFTINSLIEYVGYQENVTQLSDSSIAEDDELSLLKANAEIITGHTLQSIRNRCSVPYKMTIPRKFANHDYIFFRPSKYSFTAFISQPGYGRSTLLSHLVQEMFIDETAPFKKDITVFFSADSLFNKEQQEISLEDKVKAKIGLHPGTDLNSFFNEQYKKFGIKLNIIIDGFSELVINKTSKLKIFDNILNLISSIGDNNSIKLILSMRSAKWIEFYESFKNVAYLKNKWFAGSYLTDNSNVPPLTEVEVEQIFNKISPTDFSKISESLKSHLKFPFQIQWYYRLREEYPNFESYTNIIHYEIIARFIKEKIYNSTYATEKALFCQKIVHLTNYGRRGYSVSKVDLFKQIPVFQNAYDELLADGILMEEVQLNANFSIENVRFIQPHIYEYFLFIELYELFNHQMDNRFFELINDEYIGNQVRFQLLQWSARLMIKCHKLTEMNALLSLNLDNFEKNYLIYFIAENLSYNKKRDPELANQIKEQKVHQLLIKEIVYLDFTDSSFKETLNCLIEVADSKEIELSYHSILAIFDCMSLNPNQILERLEKMDDLTDEASKWELNPYELIKIIYLKLKGIEIRESSVLDFLEDYKANKLQISEDSMPSAKDRINLFHLFLANMFYGSPEGVLKIVKSIFRIFPKMSKTRNTFSLYLLSSAAYASVKINPGKKTDQLENILDNLYADSRIKPTLYSQSVFLFFKAEQSKYRKEYELALQYAEECLYIYKRNYLAIQELFAYNLIISIYNEMGNLSKVEEYTHKRMYLLKSRGISLSIFNPALSLK
ncbi:hypothetical protein EZ428_08035 [Pedobacter frigiditerrae]|uniref:NACHT domain-containing protein n=1 Tax=Pedobacter frigiditerrae TaxID=2530452 RepID=A0A4R0MWT8_9SPHI|nr:hypothetical protein [Pedobacter frigiditerrae]TCC91698.1 hypothetical protein EZ428_08035 [Pedobacter frigiditerrae]